MLTNNELQELLDERNPLKESLLSMFKFLKEHTYLTIERKGKDLVEVVRRLGDARLYPVVDRRLKLVFATEGSGHDVLRQELFYYHYHAADPNLDLPHDNPFRARDRYIIDRYGYFISSMRPSVIVVGEKYRPDKFDKDLFLLYELDRF